MASSDAAETTAGDTGRLYDAQYVSPMSQSPPQTTAVSDQRPAAQDGSRAVNGYDPHDSGSAEESGEEEGSEEEDEEDEEEEEEEETDDEDEEPALKYERISGSVPDLLKKDSASAVAISATRMALGTHGGFVHILDHSGKHLTFYRRHTASIVDMSFDTMGDFVATASIDGQVAVQSLTIQESYVFDMKRPMRTVALEPGFGRRSTRAIVCGGLNGNLVLREKGWLGHKETVLHAGEGPIWQVRWQGSLIAWANDLGVKIYDCISQTRITFIDRPHDSPRPDLFKCTLHWQDDSTLLIAWADHIKVARIRARPRAPTTPSNGNVPPLLVEITAVFQLDCMIAGIVPHMLQPPLGAPPEESVASAVATINALAVAPAAPPTEPPKIGPPPSLTSFLIVAYTPPDASFLNERTEDRSQQARKAAERPELRIISRSGEELAADALSITDFHRWSCNDYLLASVPANSSSSLDSAQRGSTGSGGGLSPAAEFAAQSYVVMSPRDLVLVRPRDRRDHVAWLVERERYEEALEQIERIEAEEGPKSTVVNTAISTMGGKKDGGDKDGREYLSAAEIGQRYIEYLVSEGDFLKAARLCPKVCGHNTQRWEEWIFVFAERRQLQAIIPYVPTKSPRLDHLVYEMMLAHFLTHDQQALLQTIKEWPSDIYDISAVIFAVRSELEKAPSSSSRTMSTAVSSSSSNKLMECLAELYTANRQYGKALPFFLRLRRPNVFDLIREHNLFTDVRDQVLLLVQFDDELMKQRQREHEEQPTVDTPNGSMLEPKSEAIRLLVDNIHSIPIIRVVQQLEKFSYYLFLYLDALVMEKDPTLTADFADLQVKLYAEFATGRLIDFLRASSYYNLERAYRVCEERDLVPEMVFLLGRMGNNRQALTLIIERLGDVQRAIEFAKEQADDDLWEDLLKYSETRPAFIRGLLENVGVEISPIRLIRRIKNGLEIPGLKEALIKILQDFHLQISLLEGCRAIMDGDSSNLSKRLQSDQSNGFFLTAKSTCLICNRTLQETPQRLLLLFLCRHVVHAACATDEELPLQPAPALRTVGAGGMLNSGINGKLAFESTVRPKLRGGCPVCHKRDEGLRA